MTKAIFKSCWSGNKGPQTVHCRLTQQHVGKRQEVEKFVHERSGLIYEYRKESGKWVGKVVAAGIS